MACADGTILDMMEGAIKSQVDSASKVKYKLAQVTYKFIIARRGLNSQQEASETIWADSHESEEICFDHILLKLRVLACSLARSAGYFILAHLGVFETDLLTQNDSRTICTLHDMLQTAIGHRHIETVAKCSGVV
ncbi:hypothetical protein GGX14DRAFT_397370 [Mycena pura]|uniref:Uncharacterized protein n=1 Tax=Mycena pura TaxID=153505 RepID=A0AAD6Y8Y3_9AGAR|nr:hypothetical protein GGX14DRAFT_397370 [Mycena pura]